MSTTTTTTPPHTVELGGRIVSIERPTGLKASRALALMRALSKAMPDLQSDLARFRREYERENVLELDRVQAKLRFPPRPLVDDAGEYLVDEHDEVRYMPSPVDRLTDEDWVNAGGVYKIAASPSTPEVIAALFDRALEVAEEHVYALLALFTIGNRELKAARAAGGLEELIASTVEELLDDAYADELLELAVVVGETVDHHFVRKTRELGARTGKALRLLGIDLPTKVRPQEEQAETTTSSSTSTDTPSDSRPSSSTDTAASTDGPPTSPSTPRGTSSSSSADSANGTPTDEPSSSLTPAAT
jgi:hypothetical protein